MLKRGLILLLIGVLVLVPTSLSARTPTYNVILQSCPVANRPAVIKVIMDYTRVNPLRAKYLVDSAPRVLAVGWSAAKADRFRDRLKAAGARVRVLRR